MNTHEQDDIRQYNMPYLIADVIGFLIAIGVAISLIVPAGVIGVILSAMKGASIGTNAFLILLEIISLCCIYTDVARVYTGRMVKLSPAIQKIVIIVCAILALVSCVFCIFANLT